MKTSDNLDKDEKTLCLTEREFHLRQVERKNRITIIKEEMDSSIKIISGSFSDIGTSTLQNSTSGKFSTRSRVFRLTVMHLKIRSKM